MARTGDVSPRVTLRVSRSIQEVILGCQNFEELPRSWILKQIDRNSEASMHYICQYESDVYIQMLVGGFKYFFFFTPKIGEDEPILTHIFFSWVGSTTNQRRFQQLKILQIHDFNIGFPVCWISHGSVFRGSPREFGHLWLSKATWYFLI